MKPTIKKATIIMRKVYVLCTLSFLLVFSSFGQSVLNPNDTVKTYNSSTPPTQPAYGQIGKWVRTKRLSWNTDEYKCYFYKGYAFRLHFPKSYNPAANDGKKYPMLVFFHGLGEKGNDIYDNEYQLYHGGDVFQAAVDNGTFDGYVLAMQCLGNGFWTDAQYQYITEIINYMITNNKLDAFAVNYNGLSAGGDATWGMTYDYPTYTASSIPMSAASLNFTTQDYLNKLKFLPVWNIQGGQDAAPAPYTEHQVRDAYLAAGANFTTKEFSTLGHDTWDSTWLLPDFWPYMLRAYSSNPWTLYGRTKFCPGDNINVTIGLAPGYQAYQWRFNGNAISVPASASSIQVTQPGIYDARVQRNGIWSDWSRTPVNIIVQGAYQTPPIQVASAMSNVIPAADGRNYVDLQVSGTDNDTSYIWKKVGSDSVYSTNPVFRATQPGYYILAATPQYACSALYSPAFKVIDAKGPNAPTAVKSLTANAISNTQIQLGWSPANQQANVPTALEIYRGTASGSYSLIGQVGPAVRSFVDSMLSPKVKYFYALRAVDSTGAAPLSNEASATTSSDTSAPTIPTNLKSTYTTPSTISIAWTASTDNVAVDHYNIYVNGTLSNVTKQTSFVLTGLVQNQPYAIYVKAADASGNISSASNQIIAEPILGGLKYGFYITNPLSKLPDFSTLTPSTTGVSANTDISVATQTVNYGFLWQGYINVPKDGSYTFATTSDDGSALWFNSYTPTGTPTVNNDGAHSSTTVSSKALTLTAGIYPICIEFFQATGGANMSVSWFSKLGLGTTTLQTIPNSYFTGTYVNAGSVPAVPTTVKATATAYNKIGLTWKDNSSNETGFEVYRSASATGTYNIVGTTAANTTAFTDSTLAPSTTYYYKLQAINKYGNSGLSKQDTTISASNGLNYYFYTGIWSVLPDFTTLTPAKTGVSSTTDLSVATQSANYGFVWHGYINITKAGSYTFGTTSDDGSALWFNSNTATGTPTVNNDGLHGATAVTSSAITLAKGTYPVTIEFFQQGGGASMVVTYKVPGTTSQVTIPNSAFYQAVIGAVPSATTFALPATPVAPANFTATATSSSKISLTWKKVTGATGYQLLRSIGDNTNYILINTLASSAISYSDSGLNANLIHYYQIKATGTGGTASAASTASATTKDNAPVIAKLNSIAVPYGVTTTTVVNATDSDGDALTYTSANLPAFANVVSNGSNGVSLITNPAQSDLGVYNNVKIVAADAYGGKDSTVFTLTVNSNFPPSIDTIVNYTLNENDSIGIALSAHDSNSGDVLTFSVAGTPNAYTLTDNGNGTATLTLHPDYLSAGTYSPVVTVNDGNGGVTTRQFTVVVKDKNPTTNIYARFKYNTPIGAPWNSITGTTTNNLIDENGNTTNVGLALQTSWFGNYNSGVTTGNNSGVYPDAVLADYYYFGIYGGPETVDTKVTGLDTAKLYNLTFFGGSNFASVADNGSTVYTIGSQSDTLRVQNNTTNTVTINGVKPAADGTITYTMSKGLNTPAGYINSLVITSTYDDGNAPAPATSLTAQNAGTGVQLTWTDVAFNEAGYNVYRALTSNQVYTLVGTTSANATSYTDTSANGNVQYSYKIAAFNAHGVSAYSNVATITTTDKIPQLIAISDVILKSNQTATVNIIAKDDTTDHVTLSVSGLPSFATFTDNGNGTGKISVTPDANSVGGYNVTITATDNSNISSTTSFNILVSDPNISSTYLSFSDNAHSVPKPWNLVGPYPIVGSSYSNLTDDSNTPSGITLTFKNGFQGGVVESGMQPVNGVGIYPNVVMRTAEYDASNTKDTITLTGLSTSKLYNFVFFNSHDDGKNGTTNFTVGTTTVTLNATGNISKTVQINGVAPDATGKVYVVVSKATGADFAFISTMIIQSYATTYTSIAPANLRTTAITRNSIGLQWQDRSNTETGYQIYRAADSVSTYTLLATVAAGITTYTDANLASNKTYNYAVRAIYSGSAYSAFSNTVAASTYAYNVYINYTASNDAPLPWNNLDAPPQLGYTWNNFFDEKGFVTSTGMLLTSTWAGISNLGVNPLNNSGVYPDTVNIDSYTLFTGQTATFQVTGLNLGMKYNFTFFASNTNYTDANAAYTINGVTTILDASLNLNTTATIYGVTPDSYGNVTITVSGGDAGSQFALLGAMVINGYTPSASNIVPSLPASQSQAIAQAGDVTDNSVAVSKKSSGDIKAFPNPFHDNYTLSVPAQSNNSRVQVMMYDITGKMVYSNEFGGLYKGVNSLKVITTSNLSAGIYNVVVRNVDTKDAKIIKILKQ